MLKSGKEQEGSGAAGKAEAAAVAGAAPAIAVPAARSQAAAAAVTARVATAVGRLGVSPVPPAPGVRPGSPYRSHLLSKHILFIPTLSPSQRQLTGCSLPCFGDWQSRFLLPRRLREPPRLVLVGVPAAWAVRFLSQLDPGLFRVLSPGWLIKPYGILWV